MFNMPLKTCLLGLTVISLAVTAWAQPPFTGQSTSRPTLSPYLGFGGNTGFNTDLSNYFTIVLPQIRAQQELQRQQGQISQLQRQQSITPYAGSRSPGPIQSPTIRSTGHTTFFNNYSHYYTIQQGRR